MHGKTDLVSHDGRGLFADMPNPMRAVRYPSNWELSTARALAIVKFLHGQGIPPERLAATGYGEFHPLDARSSDEAYARNRRIELKLTSR